jgi:hypothetical protein
MAKKKKLAQRIGTPRIGSIPGRANFPDLRTPQPKNPGKFGGVFNPLPRTGKGGGGIFDAPALPAPGSTGPTAAYPGFPPPGTYDPQLDAQLRASERGLRDFIFDTRRSGTRDTIDYGLKREDAAIARTRGRRDLATALGQTVEDYRTARGDIGTEYDRSLFDVTRNRDRGMEDIGTARGQTQEDFDRGRGRLTEDHSRALDVLNRNYRIQASGQNQAGRVAGVMRGGYAAQAEAKRAANKAFEQQPIDQGLARGVEDQDRSLGRALSQLDTSEGRLGQDFDLSTGRLGENRDRSMLGLNTQSGRAVEANQTQGKRLEQDFTRLLGTPGSPRSGALYQGYSRGVEDRQTAEQRARREGREFGQDIGQTAYYQARYGAGTLPIWNPKGGGPRRRDAYTPPRRRGGRR